MSLIADPTLLALWKDAQRQPSNEWASVAVWSQLWNKHVFWEKEWVICPETPPGGKGRRRVDLTIKRVGRDEALAVLTFHEAKPLDTLGKEENKSRAIIAEGTLGNSRVQQVRNPGAYECGSS
jgi:hypothetical protein